MKDFSGNLRCVTTTDDHDKASEALQYSPEEEAMIRAQEQEQPAPKATTREERLEDARRRIPNFDRDTFKASAELWDGVLRICADHPHGLDLANKIATDPKLRRELLELPVHLSMARAGFYAEQLGTEEGKNRFRKRAFDGISE